MTTEELEISEVAETYGLEISRERLSDGSFVWDLLLCDDVVHCVSERAAITLQHEIAVAIHKATR